MRAGEALAPVAYFEQILSRDSFPPLSKIAPNREPSMVETPDAEIMLPPVSPDDPCGPDLDLAGDAEFMNFVAATDGLLPTRNYYAFNRESIDFPAAFQTAENLLQRSHDLRLLVLLAKLSILNRDIGGFAHWLSAIAWSLRTHWDEVHPRADEGDYSVRLAQLQSLDERVAVELPLQYAPLAHGQRDGALVFRAQLVALGEAKPYVESRINARGESETSAAEKLAPAAAIDRILLSVEIEKLVEIHRTVQRIGDALAAITNITAERVGFEKAVGFKALAPLVQRMADFLQGALAKRDPTLAPAPEAPGGERAGESAQAETTAAPGALATLADVDAALGAALGYFAAAEPSSPALLLIGQARETLGKNLYDVMKLLAPTHADAARVFVGPDGAFTVPVSSLSGAPSAEFTRAEAAAAPSRAAALALIDSVASHMRRVEPSSPAPYLLDRAKALASRDFLALLQDVLSEEDLASMKNGR